MNNQTFVNDALSLINVLPSGTDASAEDGALALRAVTELADEWAEDGISVNWSGEAELADQCTLSGLELTALKHAVAIRLCPHFGREPSQSLIAIASSSYGKLQRTQMARDLTEIQLSMPAAEAGLPYYDILTDR